MDVLGQVPYGRALELQSSFGTKSWPAAGGKILLLLEHRP